MVNAERCALLFDLREAAGCVLNAPEPQLMSNCAKCPRLKSGNFIAKGQAIRFLEKFTVETLVGSGFPLGDICRT